MTLQISVEASEDLRHQLFSTLEIEDYNERVRKARRINALQASWGEEKIEYKKDCEPYVTEQDLIDLQEAEKKEKDDNYNN
jgi:hypothetical protein